MTRSTGAAEAMGKEEALRLKRKRGSCRDGVWWGGHAIED